MILLLLAACGTPSTDGTNSNQDAEANQEKASLQTVKIALNWYPEPEFGGFYEGVISGSYEKAGFDVEIIPGGPGAPSIGLMDTNKAQAAISAADDLLIKRSKGAKAIAVYPVFQTSPQGLMAHSVSGIERIEDIPPGTNISMEIGSPFQQHVWKTYDWGDTRKAVSSSGLIGSFLRDESAIQQAYITAEPCLAEEAGATPVFLGAHETGWNPYGALLVLPDPLPDWSDGFVQATHAAWQAYLEAPARANAEILKAAQHLKPEVMDCVTKAQTSYIHGEDGLGKMTATRWDQMNGHLVGLGLLPEGSTAAGTWKSFDF